MELSIINKKLAMDSRDIAKLTHKTHNHVIRDIRNMITKLDGSKLDCPDLGCPKGIEEKVYYNSQNKPQPYFLLDYSNTITLLTGYSVELRKAVVDRWIFLEKEYSKSRSKSIEVRNIFTDELKDRGYTKPVEFIQTTKQMKSKLNIQHKKAEMTKKELLAITASETLAQLMLDDEYGYKEVNPVCVEATEIVVKAKTKRITA